MGSVLPTSQRRAIDVSARSSTNSSLDLPRRRTRSAPRIRMHASSAAVQQQRVLVQKPGWKAVAALTEGHRGRLPP
eukprot:1722916-Rhodomonas_salina.4